VRDHVLCRRLDRLSRELHVDSAPALTCGAARTSASTSSRMLRYRSGMTTAFVTSESTQTAMPSSRAASTSGTVLIPTTSAPAARSSRPSAGVSYVGPDTHAYVPSASVARGRPSACAARNTCARSAGEYASDSGRKRA
jgi:hypothetical protein